MKPFTVRLNFHADLNFFLGSRVGRGVIERTLTEKTSVKDVIESCGVPHPEVDLILLNRQPIDFAYTVAGDVEIEVFPVGAGPPQIKEKRLQYSGDLSFIADGHLGKLTRNLRPLLTRDRRLLMHAIVRHGYYPRSQNADEQTIEVIRRFELFESIAPFTRCLRCNERLREVAKTEVIEKLEPLTKIYYEQFRRCTGCGQIYWTGSHFEKLQKRIEIIQSRLMGKRDV